MMEPSNRVAPTKWKPSDGNILRWFSKKPISPADVGGRRIAAYRVGVSDRRAVAAGAIRAHHVAALVIGHESPTW